jgi:organic radical activating enzyme
MSIPDILAAIQQADPDPSLVVITGGEPTIQEGISELAEAIRAPVALETNGTNSLGEISGAFKFIAVSPKSIESLLPTVLDVCDEVKLVIGSSDPSMLLEACLAHPGNFPIWLQPESNSEEALGKVIAIMSQLNDYRLRVGHQMHKIRGWQ